MNSHDLDRIRRETFIQHVDFHSEIGSTNTRALAMAVEIESFPVLVLTERQTAGRGRGGNAWWTGEGALTFSVVLQSRDYAISPNRSPLLSLTSGFAVAEAIADLIPAADVRLKWPNDVFMNGRKACGILLETSSQRPESIVLGIGINVNNVITQAPAELQSIATSLADVAGQEFNRTDVLIRVLQQLQKYLQLIPNESAHLADRWRERCYLQGRTVQVHSGSSRPDSERVTGVCQGIDDDGALILQTETGIVRCISGIVAKIL